MPQFTTGDYVVDRDGFRGIITKVTEWQGSRWYDVRFRSGEAVRYDADLSLDPSLDGRLQIDPAA